MADPYLNWENLVLEGGGVKGAAEIGVVVGMHRDGVLQKIKRFAGSSIGAFIVSLIACGAKCDWLTTRVFQLDFKSFRDDSWGIIADCYRMYYNKGWYIGDALCEKFKELLVELQVNPEITLEGVYQKFGKELRITTTLVSKRGDKPILRLQWLDRHSYPELELYKAVRMSAGFPYFFQAVPFENSDAIDGGTLMNYPISAFDVRGTPNYQTIGVKLLSREEFEELNCGNRAEDPDTRIPNIQEFTQALIDGFYTAVQRAHEHTEDWERTIPVNTGNVSAMNLDITEAIKKDLYNQGLAAWTAFKTLRGLTYPSNPK